jgi:hypothetical protein
MPPIGFSTGALFKDALSDGVTAALQMHLEVIELSALRFRELASLVEFVHAADLTAFHYVSLHAPTDYTAEQEPAVASALLTLANQFHWPVVVHPDCIVNQEVWKPFGQWLCIENMDKRKKAGRTLEELQSVFGAFPDARLCFDIAHARQVDSSMTEAYRILRELSNRICQIHMSEVTSSSKHDRISESAVAAFREVADQLPLNAPVILETPVTPEQALGEIAQAARIFAPAAPTFVAVVPA